MFVRRKRIEKLEKEVERLQGEVNQALNTWMALAKEKSEKWDLILDHLNLEYRVSKPELTKKVKKHKKAGKEAF